MNDNGKTSVQVEIYGTKYKLLADSASSASYVTMVAARVNEQMHAIAAQHPRLDISRLAVLAAINLSDELLKTREQMERSNAVSMEKKNHELGELRSRYDESVRELNELRVKHDDAVRELGDIREQHGETVRELDELRRKYDESVRALSEIRGQHDEAKRELNEVSAEYDEAKRQLNEVSAEYEDVKLQLNGLGARYEAAKRELAELSGRYEAARRELETVKLDYEDAQQKLRSIESQLSEQSLEPVSQVQTESPEDPSIYEQLEKLKQEYAKLQQEFNEWIQLTEDEMRN